jgi:hypothetical protein
VKGFVMLADEKVARLGLRQMIDLPPVFLGREASLATVEVIKTQKELNNRVIVTVEVRTSTGRASFPTKLDDRGSMSENETAAFREVLTLLEEAADALRLRLG